MSIRKKYTYFTSNSWDYSVKRKFLQNKLWRDKAVSMMEQNSGSTIHWRRLDDKEYDEQLRIKLVEEVKEVMVATTQDSLKAEIADVYEALDALMQLHGINKEEVNDIQACKRTERGGFENRVYVEIAEHPAGSYGEKYCLADPVKCPEIL